MNISFPGVRTNLILKKILVSLLFLYLGSAAFSQEVRIKCTDEPLNEILITLRDSYGLMLSFDDKELSKYILTVDNKFNSIPQAFDYLFKELPLGYEVDDGVYVIYNIRTTEKQKKYVVAGRISDRTNAETLPFSSILINNSGLISDAKGNFSFTSKTDSVFNIKISYLGYYILDTVMPAGTSYNFRLTPSVIALQEVVVEGSVIARTINTGSSPGISRLNHKIAYFLPGNGDNSIFNLLRLQTGILAAGEQSADLIIWGSYEGQSQIIFDGFTLYGMKNFNDNISAVNPFVAKDIKVLKGAYGAEYGERTGGIVDITGIDGNRLSPSVQLCINNMTLNGLASVPFKKKSSLIVAYRQTYYDLYDDIELTTSGSGRGRQGGGVDHYVPPDYIFRDVNLKYSGSGKKSNYYLSLYGGRDNFDYTLNEESQRNYISMDYSEQNIQYGAAAFYGLTWKDRNISNLTISYSSLQTGRDQENVVERTAGNQIFYNYSEQYEAAINEINGRVDNKFVLTERHTAEAGMGLLYYYITLLEGSRQDIASDTNDILPLPYLYLQDKITLFKKLTLKPGIRTGFHIISKKAYFQPRFSVMYRFNDNIRMNSAFGLYNQFIAKNLIMDESGNRRLVWALCDNDEIPVLNSHSYTLGFSFNRNDFTVSMEGYLKSTGGITRYLENSEGLIRYEGDGKTKGLDFFIKKEFKNQTIWISYTLSKTEEHFPYFPDEEYIPAMHDQRHEIKLAGLAKLKSFHFSANYVYGSGFPDPALLPAVVDYGQSYSRLDAAIIYKLPARKIHLDAGISVLNVLNRENIKYSNVTRVPTDETTTESIYAEAVPLTPTLFLNIYF
ncbi:MAG: TonB-dependent receptor [Bacteroidales bacterium]|nr:MAG: TonB-dependent receptor [Bacteroidales bacterium]